MGRPIKKQGERRSKSLVTLGEKDKEVKALKRIITRYKKTLSGKEIFPDEITCRECKITKEKDKFKVYELDTRMGICNKCTREGRLKTERMKQTEEATEKATELMAQTLKTIEKLYERYKLPLEKNLIADVLMGITEAVHSLQTGVKYTKYDETATPVTQIGEILNTKIIWPMVMYALGISDSQVQAAKILGISRNTLRMRMSEIEKERPRLIDEYRCREKWIKRKVKIQGYLEMDPNMEVRHEEVFGGVCVIDSSISD